jgi:hypothetical protein
MAEDWSLKEVAATVAEYFAMLDLELRGEPFNKSERIRRLQEVVGRSDGSIQRKHANISAILVEQGYPYVDGFKPLSHYQRLLKQEVLARLERDTELGAATAAAVEAPAEIPQSPVLLSEVFVRAPAKREDTYVYERPRTARPPVDYLEREARNAKLGLRGEEWVLSVEHKRLWESGHKHLAEKLQHASRTADGLGYDILSFEPDGSDRYIEVKTTRFGQMTPFYASRGEVAFSEEQSPRFHLYRVFKFRESPRVFVLTGSLRDSCRLDPVQYRAAVG